MKLAHLSPLICVFLSYSALAAPIPVEKPVVITQKLKSQDLADALSYPARVVPLASASVLSDGDGMIKTIHVLLGQKVKRGQALVTLIHTDPVFQYTPLIVRAPVAGVISAIEVNEGSQLNHGQLVAVVTDLSRMKIIVEVPAQDLRYLRAGMAGEFQLQGQEKPEAVKIKGLSGVVDPATGTAPCELVRLNADDKDSPAFAGVLGRVLLRANQHRGILIPEHALLFRGSDPFVRVLESGKAKRLAVKLGSRQRGSVEILEGLKEGATLIERSNKFVSDGEEVTVEAPTPAGT